MKNSSMIQNEKYVHYIFWKSDNFKRLLKFIIIVKEAVFQMFTITVHVFGWLLNKMGKAQRFDEASYV